MDVEKCNTRMLMWIKIRFLPTHSHIQQSTQITSNISAVRLLFSMSVLDNSFCRDGVHKATALASRIFNSRSTDCVFDLGLGFHVLALALQVKSLAW